MPLRKLVLLCAVALTLAACSSDSITGPATTQTPPRYEEQGGGMLGGGGVIRPNLDSGGGMLGGGG
jgi:hypothetical protein